MNSSHCLVLSLLALLASGSVLADASLKFTSRISTGPFATATGSTVELALDGAAPIEGTFLARVISPDHPAKWMILEDDAKKILLIDEGDLKTVPADVDQYQKLVDPIAQDGENCAAYAMLHETLQLGLNGMAPKLNLDDEGRLALLGYYMSQYYDNGAHKFSVEGVLASKGPTYGFTCEGPTKFIDNESAIAYIQKEAALAHPVIIEFNIGPDMIASSYDEIHFEEHTGKDDPRLWLPRQVGQKDSGGHAIVLEGTFTASGRTKAVVLDSDWTDPRIWDLAKYLNSKTKMSEILFHSCH